LYVKQKLLIQLAEDTSESGVDRRESVC
jgi:hypothetical protein